MTTAPDLMGDRSPGPSGSGGSVMKWSGRFKDDWLGVHFAANVFVASTVLWLIVRGFANLNPIWAISSMIAASDPVVKQALKTFRGRIVNSLVGCAIGLAVLTAPGSSEWKLPLGMGLAVLVSSYVVGQQVMLRQAPITAAIVIASELEKHSRLTGVELGLRRVGEVLLGCVVGVMVSWMMSKLWPLAQSKQPEKAAKS